MTDEQAQLVDDETVRTLARVADLNLADKQLDAVRDTLAAWLPAANELNEKMARRDHWTVIPITVFVHREDEEEAK